MAMGWLALGVFFFGLLFLLARAFVALPPSSLARAVRTFIAVFSALAGTGLLMLGRFGLAFVAIAAAGVAVRSLIADRSPASRIDAAGEEAGEAAIETRFLRMRLDKSNGAVEGEVLRGDFDGRSLAALGLPDLLELLAEVTRDDPDSVVLLEAYLDRRAPDWRTGQGDGHASDAPPANETLDEQTALEILGLRAGASVEEIKGAHRRLMAQMHPDRGGSTWIASRLNSAKDLLLRARG
jgi:hypothetical protein